MKMTLKRLDDAYHMQATNELGNTVETDGSPDIGGGNKAMSPMQLLLAALGSCSTIDIVMILKKMRQPLDDIQISIDSDRQQGETPSLFTNIRVHYRLYGNIKSEKAEQAIQMSMEKYCSVAKIMEKTAEISWSYELIAS